MSARSTRHEHARVRAAEARRYVEREGVSLRQASRRAHTDPRTVLKVFPDSFTKDGGRWLAAPDRQAFRMRIASTKGVVERTTRGSGARSTVSHHHNAIRSYLKPDGGDARVLEPFAGKRVGGVALETDPEAIVEMWLEGQLDFLDIYVTQ